MNDDQEITAMTSIVKALDGLKDDEARQRALRWAMSRYGVVASFGAAPGRLAASPEEDVAGEPYDFAALFDAADPQTDEEKALAAGYWFQVKEGNTDLDAQTLNSALKDLGHGITNITVALGRLENRKPSLVRQTKKSGKSKQARKKYRVTTAGKRAAEKMLAGHRLDEQ